ncbi:MAG: porin, partial [Steroidobacteraceae bacterium]
MRNLIVAAAVAAACMTSVSAFAADETTKVSGKAFIDFTNKSTDGNVATDGYGVDVTRFYVDIKHTFNDVWAADVTTDFQYSSAVSATEVFIKKAYLQGTFSDAFTLRVGSADMPWVPFVEDLYGFRYFEKVMIDRTGYGTSSDWGVHAFGKAADGMFSYAVSAVNGNGYKNPTRSKSMDFEGRISLVPIKGLTIGAGFRSGKLGQDNETVTANLNTNSRFDAVVAYATDKFRIGAEYFDSKNGKSSEVIAATETQENG